MFINGMSYNLVLLTQFLLHRASNISLFLKLRLLKDMYTSKCNFLELGTSYANLNPIMILLSPCFQNHLILNMLIVLNAVCSNLALLTQFSLYSTPNISLSLKLRQYKDIHASKFNFLELRASDTIFI